MSGRLIAIEGVDGSGKTTQFALLKKYFESAGHTVRSIHFPRHQEKFFGVVVDDYLNGKFGDATKIDPRLASILYACDRFEAKDTLLQWLSDGDIVILDRYMTSNKGHQVGKLDNDEEKAAMLTWLDEMEYQVFGIPKPDFVFYLDVDFEHVQDMLQTRGRADKEYIDGEYDQHEGSDDHIKRAQSAYRFTAERYPYWHTITCVKEGQLLTPEQIHQKIITIITS